MPTAGILLREEEDTREAGTLPDMPESDKIGPTGAGQAGVSVGVSVLLEVDEEVELLVEVLEGVDVCDAVRDEEGVPV